jgi:uncharacterized protein
MSKEKFEEVISDNYKTKGASILLGSGIFNKEVVANAKVHIPLKTLNRHGLIAGATGTGKTKTIQVLCEQLSKNGVPVLMMDIKGDFSGIAAQGELKDFIKERHDKIDVPYENTAFSTELYSLSEQDGVRLRATVEEFGSVLFSRILDLNETQSGIVSIIFKYCNDNSLPLISLVDFKKMLQYATEEGKEEFEDAYGRITTASTGSILRKVIELEEQGADLFFGAPSFEIDDLMRIDDKGRGYVNVIRLTDIQDRPKLFSTFMLCLLSEIYNKMPEKGDLEQPELVLFIDEAHLLFNEASKALLNQIETIIKLIRSKGIGVYFITQNPQDIPASVLAQLGLKIQHALRAFTANDRKAIKLTAENYPESEFYNAEDELTQLGIGEAFVTALNEKGIPTQLVATMLRAPESRMDVLTNDEIQNVLNDSKLYKKYKENEDKDGAAVLIEKKITEATEKAEEEKEEEIENEPEPKRQNPIIKFLTSAAFISGIFRVIMMLFRRKR